MVWAAVAISIFEERNINTDYLLSQPELTLQGLGPVQCVMSTEGESVRGGGGGEGRW